MDIFRPIQQIHGINLYCNIQWSFASHATDTCINTIMLQHRMAFFGHIEQNSNKELSDPLCKA